MASTETTPAQDAGSVEAGLDALETTAYHFTRRPHFYGDGGDHR